MTALSMFEVGGCVRDDLLGIPTKDIDFVVITESFDTMRESLAAEGFSIWQERPEFGAIRAGVPNGHPLRDRTKDADFVLARRDGPTADGRRPMFVEPATLETDLARRDFTVNAMARDVDGTIIDPHGGQVDLEARRLRFVGDPMTRIREDGLRVVRGFRFMVTKGLTPDDATWEALTSREAADMLRGVATERRCEELERMFHFDTLHSMNLLAGLPVLTQQAMFHGQLRLSATMTTKTRRTQ